jgi:hypothetical protein
VVPRAGLDGCGKPRPHRDSILGPSSPFQVAIQTELSRPTLHTYLCVCVCVCVCTYIYVNMESQYTVINPAARSFRVFGYKPHGTDVEGGTDRRVVHFTIYAIHSAGHVARTGELKKCILHRGRTF